jgi:hypothetical protein
VSRTRATGTASFIRMSPPSPRPSKVRSHWSRRTASISESRSEVHCASSCR